MGFTESKYGYQGDAEAPQLLRRLARRNPDVEWVLVGRNDLDDREFEPNVTNPWKGRPKGPSHGLADKISWLIGSLDGVVIHAGQHGTSHMSIPESKVTWAEAQADPFHKMTTPQDWSCTYGGFIIRGLNILGDRTDGRAPIVWLITDPRNFHKARDVKWPTGCDDILAQYQYSRFQRHERFRDSRSPKDIPHFYAGEITPDRDGEIWVAEHRYRYAGLELMILPDDWEKWGQAGFHDRKPAGIASTSFNDGRGGREPRRSELIRDYLLSEFPDADVYGKWDPVSLGDVPSGTVIENNPTEFPELLNRWRVTLSLPAIGSPWTVAKPYQLWAANVVGFMVDKLDDQGWILPSRRFVEPAQPIGEVDGVKFYSVRNDWMDADLKLARWLRVETPQEFHERAKFVVSDVNVWTSLARAQRELLRRRWDEALVETEIERKLGLSWSRPKPPERWGVTGPEL